MAGGTVPGTGVAGGALPVGGVAGTGVAGGALPAGGVAGGKGPVCMKTHPMLLFTL